jgi:hypothetical protein
MTEALVGLLFLLVGALITAAFVHLGRVARDRSGKVLWYGTAVLFGFFLVAVPLVRWTDDLWLL